MEKLSVVMTKEQKEFILSLRMKAPFHRMSCSEIVRRLVDSGARHEGLGCLPGGQHGINLSPHV